MNTDDIFYSLNVDDIQQVAIDNIGRKLNIQEIEKVKRATVNKINWYDAIFFAISEEIRKK